MLARLKISFAVLLLLTCGSGEWQNLLAQHRSNSAGEEIVLGLLLEDSISVEAHYGAQFAVDEINRQGRLKGRNLRLVMRSMEGSWGVGSTKAVELVFQEEAIALIGLLNGRNAHLVEQVAAKTSVPLVSAWAADPTLAKAYVPQFFNCVPNSEQQASVLLDEMLEKRGFKNWLLVSDESYDARIAAESLLKNQMASRFPPLESITVSKSRDIEALIQLTVRTNPDALVVLCEPKMTLELITSLRELRSDPPIYCAMDLLGEDSFNALLKDRASQVYTVAPEGWDIQDPSSFSRDFELKYGRYPGIMAAYAYDAVHLVAEALSQAGPGGKDLKEFLSNQSFSGKTGLIEFDHNGNQRIPPRIIEIESEILSQPRP